jgi:MFS-type transporter involved in bile tolerance (Atg22 family)
VFRTGTPESGLTWWAQIHRYTAGAAFVILTVVAALCAVRMKDADVPDWVRRATWWATALAALTFLTTTLNTFLPGFLDGGDWRGVGQRVLLVVLSALVWILVASSTRVTVRSVEPVAAPALPATVPVGAAAEAGVPAFAGARS